MRLQGDIEKAQRYAEASVTALEALGDPNMYFIRIPRTILAELALYRGELESSRGGIQEDAAILARFGQPRAVARMLELLAFISRTASQ